MIDFVSLILGDISDCCMCAWMKVSSFHCSDFQWKVLWLLSFVSTSYTWLIRDGFKTGLNRGLWIFSRPPTASCPLSTLLKPGLHTEVPNFTHLCGLAVEIEGDHRGYRLKANSLWAFLVSKKLLARAAHVSLNPTCQILLFKWLRVDCLDYPKSCWLCSQRS